MCLMMSQGPKSYAQVLFALKFANNPNTFKHIRAEVVRAILHSDNGSLGAIPSDVLTIMHGIFTSVFSIRFMMKHISNCC